MGKHKYNHYEAQEYHRKELKRRFTPYDYANYISYKDHYTKEDLSWNTIRGYKEPYSNGEIPWIDKYWIAYTGYINSSWKKQLKHAAHKEMRNKYRQEIYHYLSAADIEDCEGDFSTNRRVIPFDDPWNWD